MIPSSAMLFTGRVHHPTGSTRKKKLLWNKSFHYHLSDSTPSHPRMIQYKLSGGNIVRKIEMLIQGLKSNKLTREETGRKIVRLVQFLKNRRLKNKAQAENKPKKEENKDIPLTQSTMPANVLAMRKNYCDIEKLRIDTQIQLPPKGPCLWMANARGWFYR